jgi:hypothetical protein
VTIPTVMILAGIVLTLVCVFFLFLVYGLASMVPITSDEPGYWSLVLGRMFGAEHGGWLAIPASFGFLLGVTFVMLGMVKRGKRRREGIRDIRQSNRALVAVVLVFVPVAAHASVTDVALKDLVARSDLVVLATVTKVEDGPVEIKAEGDEFPPVKVATARVVETWKGVVVREVRFVASPTRHCDVADAKKGEKLVLFLEKRSDSPVMMVAHIGRGGMLLHDVEGKPYATIENEVRLPAGTKTISEEKTGRIDLPLLPTKSDKKPSTRKTLTYSYSVRSIELGALRELVRSLSFRKRTGAAEAGVRRGVEPARGQSP